MSRTIFCKVKCARIFSVTTLGFDHRHPTRRVAIFPIASRRELEISDYRGALLGIEGLNRIEPFGLAWKHLGQVFKGARCASGPLFVISPCNFKPKMWIGVVGEPLLHKAFHHVTAPLGVGTPRRSINTRASGRYSSPGSADSGVVSVTTRVGRARGGGRCAAW